MRIPTARLSAFTLAELLIALAILGIIATFTIPKILTDNQNKKQSAIAREVAGMVSGALDLYRKNNTVNASTTLGVLTPYLNYAAVDTSSTLDDHLNANALYNCASNLTCLRMHGGGTLALLNAANFGGTNSTNGIYFIYDPDSQRTGVASDGPGKSIFFLQYFDGRLTTRANHVSDPGNYDPSWFSWQ